MGSISEYFRIKNEIEELKEEITKKIKNSDETTISRSESIQHLNKKIISKKKRLKTIENKVIVNIIFPLFLAVLIIAYLLFRQNL